jgi:major intracellular serine protease
MPKRIAKIDYRCHLLPYKREEDFLSIQDVEQKAGWEITAFNLPETWKYSRGEGVTVAVLDTGCDLDHDDLKNNLLPGKNFIESEKPIDLNSHGTHVAGIICAEDNDRGVVGVAPKAKVIPVKVLDKKGSGDLRRVADGIYWAADQKVDFITMSLGSPTPVPIVHKAIQYAVKKNIVIFCAAGNAGRTREIFYPAAYPETIGIGAIDQNFDRANFSCTGPDLDFLAPGVSITSTVPTNWYATLSGTSMANPFVVGIAALLLSHKKQKNLPIALKTAKDYVEMLKKYTIPTKNPEFAGKKFFEGFGIIDPRKFEEYFKS